MNNSQGKFKENEIPYAQFKELGITKQDIFSFKRDNLESLFAGKRTELIDIKGTDLRGESFSFKAKLSLARREDGSVGVNIHPMRTEIKNDFDLRGKEIECLKRGELINKIVNGERFVIQLDKETNELLRARSKDITIPNRIKDFKLSPSDREKLRQGKTIKVSDKDFVSLDLNSPRGIVFKENLELKKSIEYDRINPNVRGTLQTDKNDNEFMDYQKKQDSKKMNNIKM